MAAVELPKATKGTLQLYDQKTNELHMVAQVGFDDNFLHEFQRMPLDLATCGAAYQRRRRVIVENITTDTEFSQLAPLYARHHVVSAQSTPLFAGDRRVLGVLTTYSTDAGKPTDEQLRILDLYADQAARLIEVKQSEIALRLSKLDLETQVSDGEQKLRDIAAKLATVEERERRALASELHDYLAQLLTLGHIKLKLAQQSLDSSPRQTERYMRETAEALQHSIKYARTLMAELVPPELHQSGLQAAIRWLADNMAKKHGLTVDLRLDPEPLNLAQHQAVFLYRCVRELLINVVKHAGVDRAIVALTVDADQRLVLTVEDRGRGYDPAVKAPSGDEHFGLLSIRERLDSIGGWLTEESAIGKGTTSTLGLYLSEPALQSSSHAARSSASRDRVEQTSHEPSAQERLPLE